MLEKFSKQYLAIHDSVTGLPNSQLFYDRLAQIFALSQRYQHMFAVMLLDLKGVAAVGVDKEQRNELLAQVSKKFNSCVRDTDTVARLEDHQFGILLSRIQEEDDAANVASIILDVLSMPLSPTQQEAPFTAHIGIGIYPRNGQDLETLMANLKTALNEHNKPEDQGHYFFCTISEQGTNH